MIGWPRGELRKHGSQFVAKGKAIMRMNNPLKSRICSALALLEENPMPAGIKKLSGRNGYRLRVGNYRILYNVRDEKIIITDILPRGQAYKGGV
jgi:mRNA interferase RelE/StbE